MSRSDRPGYDPDVHGPRRVTGSGFNERVYDVVSRVPAGAVTTYGDVAAQLGRRGVARQVGFALAALPPQRDDVPWHRVVNARGELSRRSLGVPSAEQADRLVADGVEVSARGVVLGFSERRFGYGIDPAN